MKKHLIAAFMAIAVAAPVITAAPADAQRHDRGIRDYRWQGDRNSKWDPARHYSQRDRKRYRERRLGRHDRIYRGGDGRYYCKRNDGTTGLVIGGVAGGLLGNAIGGDTLGTLLGAGGGALLGREIDRGGVKCR